VVEFAIVVPVVFVLVFGLIEFGRMLMVRQSMTNATREACRMAVLATTNSDEAVEAAVRSRLQSVIPDASDADKVTVSVTPTSLSGISSGAPITVEASVDFSDVSWLPGDFLGLFDVVISAESTQERE
jgi:Flp pilus assembly protein TadG